MNDESVPENIGKTVMFAGKEWKIVSINEYGDYDLERWEQREDGLYKIGTSGVLGLPISHGHYMYLAD